MLSTTVSYLEVPGSNIRPESDYPLNDCFSYNTHYIKISFLYCMYSNCNSNKKLGTDIVESTLAYDVACKRAKKVLVMMLDGKTVCTRAKRVI
jgi:hypothetical protein